ncbi:hypothetical protein TrST_g7572 [Triparma strigata]|uniref:Uncharacterized protein n=1 Tax=Triparma strigata TaxID=1606541 RepID=A0A9W7AYB7_9STRA|nr:hypothetical protein TrST_g7572 [Triparma strigata]
MAEENDEMTTQPVVESPDTLTALLTFSVSGLDVKPPQPTPTPADEEGKEEKEEEQPAPVPAAYHVTVHVSGQASEFWPKQGEEGEVAAPVAVKFAGLQETDAFSCSTLPVPCDDGSVSKFLSSFVVVELVETPEGGEPKVVSTAELPLSKVAGDDEVTASLSFKDGWGTVDVRAQPEDELADHMLGGVQVSIYDVVVSSLPEEFKIVPPFDAATMTAEDYHATVKALVTPPAPTVEDGAEPVPAPAPSQAFSVTLNATDTSPALNLGFATWTYTPTEDGPPVEVPLTEEEIEKLKADAIEEHEKEKAELKRLKEEEEAEDEGKDDEEKKGGEDEKEEEEPEPFVPDVPTSRFVPTPTANWTLEYTVGKGSKAISGGAFFLSAASKEKFLSDPQPISLALSRNGTSTKYDDEAAGEPEAPAADAKKKKGGKKDAKAAAGDDDAAGEPEFVLKGSLNTIGLTSPGQQLVHLNADLQYEGEDEVREKSVSSAVPQAAFKVFVSSPLRDFEDSKLAVEHGMGEVVGMRQWKPKEKPRDIAGELRSELENIVFALAGEMKGLSDTELFEKVQTSGVFYDMKEKLRPAVQLAAHSRFRKAPEGEEGKEAYRSELFTALATQLNTVLINKFTKNTAVDSALFPTPADSFAKDFEMFGMRAEECVVSGRMDIAMARHEDRVALAIKASKTGEPEGMQMLSDAYDSMAKFCLISGIPGARDRALECIKLSAKVSPLSFELQLVNALTLLDFEMYDLAEESFNAALEIAQGPAKATVYAGMCVLNDAINELEKKTYDDDKESLRLRGLPMVTFPDRDLTRCAKAKDSLIKASSCVENAPARRGGLVAMLSVVEIMIDLNLSVAAQRALEIATKCENLAAKKEVERDLEAVDVAATYGLRNRLDACLALYNGDSEAALAFAQKSLEYDKTGRNYEILGKASRGAFAVSAYELSLEAFGDAAPLRIFLKLALLLIEQQTETALTRAKVISLKATAKFGSSMAWRLAGITLGELGDKVQAEYLFQESLRINSFDPITWANFALLILDGEGRLEDSVANAKESILHDLDDAFLLRQLGSKLYGKGDLSLAELMLRRSLVLNKASATKKMLGDVLRAQKKEKEAMGFFLALMDDDEFSEDEKCDLYGLIVSDYRDAKKSKELNEFIRNYGGRYSVSSNN